MSAQRKHYPAPPEVLEALERARTADPMHPRERGRSCWRPEPSGAWAYVAPLHPEHRLPTGSYRVSEDGTLTLVTPS